MPSRREFVAGLAAIAKTAPSQTTPAPAPKLPNVLMMVVDGMGWDAESPYLDKLAKQGLRFANAYSVAPDCAAGRACLLTGRYADANGVTGKGIPANDGEIFLPSILKFYGYHTALAGELGFTPARFSYGFDSTVGIGQAVDYLRSHQSLAQPWFLHISHSQPPNVVSNIDSEIASVLAELDRLGLTDTTITVVTADHGPKPDGSMYEGSTHVPLIWRGVKKAPENKGRVEHKIVESTDLLPAILEAVGLPVPPGVQGRSFLRLARRQDNEWKDRGFAQLKTAMVRDGRYKFIDNSRDLAGPFELYDLREDPHEERSLAGDMKYREHIEEYKHRLIGWRADRPGPITIPAMPLPDYAKIDPAERREAVRKASQR